MEEIDEQIKMSRLRLGELIDKSILSEINRIREKGYAPKAIIIWDVMEKILKEKFDEADNNLKIETLYGLKVVSTEIPRDIEVV